MFSSRRTAHTTSTRRTGGGLAGAAQGLMGGARRATAGTRGPTTGGVGSMAGGRRTGGRGLFGGPRATRVPKTGGGLLNSLRGPRAPRPPRGVGGGMGRSPAMGGGIVTKIKRTLMGSGRARTMPRTRHTRL